MGIKGTQKGKGPIRDRPQNDLVRKGGLEPPRFYPPDPKFPAHEESTTYTADYHLLRITTNALSSKAFQRYTDNSSPVVGFGGGHKTGHSSREGFTEVTTARAGLRHKSRHKIRRSTRGQSATKMGEPEPAPSCPDAQASIDGVAFPPVLATLVSLLFFFRGRIVCESPTGVPVNPTRVPLRSCPSRQSRWQTLRRSEP
jgi:hypothetical protein